MVCGLGPYEGFGIVVDGLDVVSDRALQFMGRTMRAAADFFLSQVGKEPLDLIDPGCRGWREVEMPAGMSREPPADCRGFVGCVVVQHQVDVKIAGDVALDLAQELEELAAAMAREAFADYLPVATSRAANKDSVPCRV